MKFGDKIVKYFPEQIATLIFQKLISNAESFLKAKIRQVIITFPADFTEFQKRGVKHAAEQIPGIEVLIKGFKSEWSGEVEITDATFEFIDGEGYKAEAVDVTDLLGKDELIAHQNELVAFKGMTVEAYDESGAAFAYKNAENKTDDLYFKVSKDGVTYDFCVEFYLCGQDTEVYKAVEALNVGDVIDLEGFLYWYNGANPHITKVTPAQ